MESGIDGRSGENGKTVRVPHIRGRARPRTDRTMVRDPGSKAHMNFFNKSAKYDINTKAAEPARGLTMTSSAPAAYEYCLQLEYYAFFRIERT